MASTLATQLAQIAAQSTNSLNLKAQKAAHAKSLIFEPKVAASQSFDTLYTICHEGFEELCLLDGRFLEFQRTIFSRQSIEEDRTMSTADENVELDRKLESFLGLVGGRLRLNPAIKAVEWLVRRFRVHEHNTSFLLTTFLPYHTLPIFTTLLSILPTTKGLPSSYRFLHPYIRSLTQPMRHAIVKAAINNTDFTSELNTYVIRISNAKQHYHALLAFWAGIMTEAVNGMLDQARSGRTGVQQQSEQDLLLRLLPTLNEGLAMKKVPELRIGCYILLSILASKGGLEEKLLSAMMENVAHGWTSETMLPGIVCLSVLAQHRGSKQLTKRLTKQLLKVQNFPQLLLKVSQQRRVDKLAGGFCLGLLTRLEKNGDYAGLATIVYITENQLLSDNQTALILKSMLLIAHRIDGNQHDACATLASSLVKITQLPGPTSLVVRQVLKDTEIDVDDLEMKLHATIRPEQSAQQLSEAVEEEEEDSGSKSSSAATFAELYQHLPIRTASEYSFLSHSASHIYHDLYKAFVASIPNKEDLAKFDESPLLRRASALEDSLYMTFYMRTWCGPHPVMARTTALQMTKSFLASSRDATVDVQAIIPYTIVALSDNAAKIRRAAADLLIEVGQFYGASEKATPERRWAFDDIYGPTEHTKDIKWLSPDVASRFLNEILIPALEECVLDANHIQSLFGKALNSSKSQEQAKAPDAKRLPQSSRLAILSSLGTHAIQTPMLTVKLRLLAVLNTVKSVGGTSRTKILLPAIQGWLALSPPDAVERCQAEHVDLDQINLQMFAALTPNDEDGRQILTAVVNGEIAADRKDIISAAFLRIRALWSSLKGDVQVGLAKTLLDLSQTSADDIQYHQTASEASADFLRSTVLSTDILLTFLSQLPTAAKLIETPPAAKRRRTSHGEVAKTPIQDAKLLSAAIRKTTFVLQLIDSSNPGSHPELLKGLFYTLAELQHFKSQVASELAYLQGLVLSSLLEILRAYKSNPGFKLDRSAIRADLLVDCVQKTASPQVQNGALLLIALLADATPELVLHSVMPIFTFMGNSILKQNDEYSAHVISQTINEVIPPLIASLRKEKRNPLVGAAELLLSFVAAYEHVPPHRRLKLLTSLVQTLGAEDFLYALLAMLVDKYGPIESINAFAAELANSFSVEVQMQTIVSYLDLVVDILKPKPELSAILLSANDDGAKDSHRSALNEMMLLPHLLSQKRLVSQTASILERDDMEAARIRDLYSTSLEKILALAETVTEHKRLHGACGDALESLLGLLSTSEFVKSVEGLLDRPNESLRRKVLRSLQLRIEQESASDAVSRASMLGFLPQLTAIIRESNDTLYKHTAVACVDKISEKYGKKDLEAVSAAAETIAGSHCLGQPDARLQITALLCLASLVEILREGIVPVLPLAIPKALEYMENSLSGGVDGQKLHNAGYAFLASLVHHLPYMVSGKYLERLLAISNVSAEADLEDEADESRFHCLRLAANQIDAKSLFGALEKNWEGAAAAGTLAVREYFEILNVGIEKHTKSTIAKHSSTLAKIFQNAFDLRRKWASATDERNASELEDEINDVAIKMIYKFNDSTFRPIFANLLEWGSSLPKSDSHGTTLRLQSLYGFTTLFFDTLKSAVTSYATYVLDPAISILQHKADQHDEHALLLWTRVLQTLTKCFAHDQDDFWQSPAHFSVIAPLLTAQLAHLPPAPLDASSSPLLPAIVELAVAADSADHHRELNSAILKHMRAERASVRLAAVKCEQALTDRLGEEWLSLLPEMLPFISELQEDDDEEVERETQRWIVKIEGVLGEKLDAMLQ